MQDISLDDVERAAARLRGVARRTPLIDGGELSREAGVEVRLKLESLQRTGSFKFRGASNAVARLDAVRGADGVATHSSGNHALALAVAAKGRRPGIAVLAAEPAAVDDAARSVASGTRQPPTNAATLADGLRAGIGALTFPIVRERVDRILPVEESEIRDWMRFAFERLKLVIEPSAAVGVAAIRSPAFRELARSAGWRRVALVICGGNVDLARLPWIDAR